MPRSCRPPGGGGQLPRRPAADATVDSTFREPDSRSREPGPSRRASRLLPATSPLDCHSLAGCARAASLCAILHLRVGRVFPLRVPLAPLRLPRAVARGAERAPASVGLCPARLPPPLPERPAAPRAASSFQLANRPSLRGCVPPASRTGACHPGDGGDARRLPLALLGALLRAPRSLCPRTGSVAAPLPPAPPPPGCEFPLRCDLPRLGRRLWNDGFRVPQPGPASAPERVSPAAARAVDREVAR